MDEETIKLKYNVAPPEFGYKVVTFSQLESSIVEFSVLWTKKYNHVTELGIDWSYSKYRCNGVRDIHFTFPMEQITGHSDYELDMSWDAERNCFHVFASAGFDFNCDEIMVVESTSEELGAWPKEETAREQSNPPDCRARD